MRYEGRGSVPLLLPLEEAAGNGVDLKLIFHAALPQLAFINCPAIVHIQLQLDQSGLGGLVLGQLLGLLPGDVVLAVRGGRGDGVVLNVGIE